MNTHATHDFAPTGYCHNCTCHVLSLDAKHPCKPSTDPEPEPERKPVDFSEITRGVVG